MILHVWLGRGFLRIPMTKRMVLWRSFLLTTSLCYRTRMNGHVTLHRKVIHLFIDYNKFTGWKELQTKGCQDACIYNSSLSFLSVLICIILPQPGSKLQILIIISSSCNIISLNLISVIWFIWQPPINHGKVFGYIRMESLISTELKKS